MATSKVGQKGSPYYQLLQIRKASSRVAGNEKLILPVKLLGQWELTGKRLLFSWLPPGESFQHTKKVGEEESHSLDAVTVALSIEF